MAMGSTDERKIGLSFVKKFLKNWFCKRSHYIFISDFRINIKIALRENWATFLIKREEEYYTEKNV